MMFCMAEMNDVLCVAQRSVKVARQCLSSRKTTDGTSRM